MRYCVEITAVCLPVMKLSKLKSHYLNLMLLGLSFITLCLWITTVNTVEDWESVPSLSSLTSSISSLSSSLSSSISSSSSSSSSWSSNIFVHTQSKTYIPRKASASINIGSGAMVTDSKSDPKLQGKIAGGNSSFEEDLRQYHELSDGHRRMFRCSALFKGDKAELGKVQRFVHQHRASFSRPMDKLLTSATRNCERFRAVRGYVSKPLSAEEESFPLAFILTAHQNVGQLERLLRVLYRPQNVYCLHVDGNAPPEFQAAAQALAACFPNVFLVSRQEHIVYAGYARLQADINCMWDLTHLTSEPQRHWSYLVNMAASELPLRTNGEMIKLFRLFKGANDIREVFKHRRLDRWDVRHIVVNNTVRRTTQRLRPAPYNLTVVKGMAYNVFSRRFVQFIFSSKEARAFLHWCRDTYSPDEHYWATLNNLYHNAFLKTPGGFKGHPDKKSYIARLIKWQNGGLSCSGPYVHRICILSSGDLPHLLDSHQVIANKFDTTLDPVAYSCMEELLQNRTRNPPPFPASRYRGLSFIPKS